MKNYGSSTLSNAYRPSLNSNFETNYDDKACIWLGVICSIIAVALAVIELIGMN